MAHLIDKDALVAEIERRIKFQQTCMKTGYRLTGKAEEEIILEYKQFLSFLDTLEVKEVDLDEYLDMELSHYGLSRTEISRVTLTASAIERIIRNAFELGLKAKQG